MSQYYYALSTLPSISLDSDQFPDREDFLQMCNDWLSPRDLRYLYATTLVPGDEETEKNSLLLQWENFECDLRNELVRWRSQRLKKDPQSYLRTDRDGTVFQSFGSVGDVAKSVVSESSPIIAEKTLNQLRWNYLDELLIGHIFDVEALQVYYLKLQILHRIAQITKEQGETRFNSQYESLSAKISESSRFSLGNME